MLTFTLARPSHHALALNDSCKIVPSVDLVLLSTQLWTKSVGLRLTVVASKTFLFSTLSVAALVHWI